MRLPRGNVLTDQTGPKSRDAGLGYILDIAAPTGQDSGHRELDAKGVLGLALAAYGYGGGALGATGGTAAASAAAPSGLAAAGTTGAQIGAAQYASGGLASLPSAAMGALGRVADVGGTAIQGGGLGSLGAAQASGQAVIPWAKQGAGQRALGGLARSGDVRGALIGQFADPYGAPLFRGGPSAYTAADTAFRYAKARQDALRQRRMGGLA